MAAIITVHIARNSGTRISIVHAVLIAVLMPVDCVMTISQLIPASIRSEARIRVRCRGGKVGVLTLSRPGPAERSVVGALAGVIPAELVVCIAAGHAIRLNQLGKERMRVVLHDFLLGIC